MKKTEAHPARSMGFLSRLYDGELSLAEKADFELHRRNCEECRRAAQEFEDVLALYKASPPEPPDSGLAARITRRLDATLRRPPIARFIPIKIDVVWASVVLVALVGAILLYSLAGSRGARGVLQTASREPVAAAPPPPSPVESPTARGLAGSAPRAERKDTARRSTEVPVQLSERLSAEKSPGAPAPQALEERQSPAPIARNEAFAEGKARAAAAPEAAAGAAPGREADMAGDEEPLRLGPGIAAPVLIKQVQPDLSSFDPRGWTNPGVIVVEAVITRRGDVVGAHVVGTRPAAELEKAVLEAIQQWRYKPATKDGQPVAVYLTIAWNDLVR